MADKKEDKKPEPAKEGEIEKAAGGGGLLSKTPVLVGIVMVVEAVVLFAGMKFLMGGPAPAAGAAIVEPAKDEHGEVKPAALDPKAKSEVPLLEVRAPNKRNGRTVIYQVKVVVSTKSEHAEQVAALIKQREALIKDRVRTIIAQSDPDRLDGGKEPGLETLRRQIKHHLDEILGEGVIEEVLVPDCIPLYRADF